MTSVLLLALLAQFPADHVVDLQGHSAGGNASRDINTNGNEVCAYNKTTDAAPDGLILKAGDAWSQGAQTAASLVAAGGLDEKKIVVDTAAATAADTVTVTCNSVALAALADGTAWVTCVGDTDAVCAIKVAAALDAQVGACADYVAVADTVYAQPFSCATYALSHAASDAAYLAANNGTDGQVLISGAASSTVPRLTAPGDLNTGIGWSSADNVSVIVGGTARLVVSGTGITSLGSLVTTTHALGTGAVGVAGALEVDGVLYIDSESHVVDGAGYILGTGNDAALRYSIGQTPDSTVLGLSVDSNGFIIAETADSSYDFAHLIQADPTIWLQSHNQSATEHLSLQHNATDGIFATGAGMVRLQPTVKGVVVPTIVAATAAEPIACAAGTVGTVVYVDDNDDTATADLCACVATGDAAYDWRSLLVTASACAEF